MYLLVTALLLIGGVEALRRLAAREFPAAAEIAPRELFRPLEQLRPSSARPAPAGDDRIAQLERLARLHEQGVLSDEELASAKSRVLAA